MKFTFEHLGNLPKASICLGNLTIICGSNNMSKTILSNAIYGLIKHLSNFGPKVSDIRDKIDLSFTVDLNQYIGSVKDSIKKNQQSYCKELSTVFDVDQELVQNTKIIVDVESLTPNFSISRRIKLGDRIVVERPANESKLTIKITPTEKTNTKELHDSITQLIYYACVDVLLPGVFFMTAERSGISIFQRELDTGRNRTIFNLREHSARARDLGQLFSNFSNYPISIQDNIDTIRDASNIRKRKSFLKGKLDAAFQTIVGGTYLTDNNDISFSVNSEKMSGVKLPIHYASSSIKSLFLLDLYIKNIAQSNDLLIIDEPELSLHPENQRKLAWLLAALSNNGIKILMTTHSDYIVKEISSLLMLGELNKDKQAQLAKELGYPQNSVLNKGHVKCYIMQKHNIKNAPIGTSGIDIESFNDEIDNMNRCYDTIMREIDNEEFF